MMMLRTLVLSAAICAGVTTFAAAQTAEQRAACGADAKKFCAGIMPGGGRLLDCLAKHKDSISPACRKVLAQQGR
jgi:hypothetical protein